MPICRARHATRGSRTASSEGPGARSTGCGWRSCRPPSRQDQAHDACGRRVHPALPAAHPAGRLPSHPPLRLPRQPPARRQARALSPAARRAIAGTARRTGPGCRPIAPARSMPDLRWRHGHARCPGAPAPLSRPPPCRTSFRDDTSRCAGHPAAPLLRHRTPIAPAGTVPFAVKASIRQVAGLAAITGSTTSPARLRRPQSPSPLAIRRPRSSPASADGGTRTSRHRYNPHSRARHPAGSLNPASMRSRSRLRPRGREPGLAAPFCARAVGFPPKST